MSTLICYEDFNSFGLEKSSQEIEEEEIKQYPDWKEMLKTCDSLVIKPSISEIYDLTELFFNK